MTNTPPKIQKRNEFGLLDGINYIFTEDGSKIDWRKMLDNKFLVPNRYNFIKRKQDIPTSIEGLEDKDLTVLLQGFRDLADKRGYTRVDYQVVTSTKDFCSVKCTINWIPNFENSMIEYSSLADAHYDSVDGIFRNYLTSMAENRAFQRCIRNSLRINICARDEIGPLKEESNNSPSTQNAFLSKKIYDNLKSLMIEHDKPFSDIQDKLLKWGVSEAKEYRTVEEIPLDKASEMIETLKKLRKKI